ncbi:transposable element Tc1 transposase [Trichonephila clavipes]|nr:transposable element Tc1 transposase [Trichonephila clavipes]
MWDYDGRIRVRRYAGERCLPECVIERYRGLTPGVMVWARSRSLLSRHQWSNLSAGQQKIVRDFYAAQHMQLLPWAAYSPDMSPTEHVWDFVGQRLARDLRPAASKRRTFTAHTSNTEFPFTSIHSKFVWFHATSYSNTYCSEWWLHQILILDT